MNDNNFPLYLAKMKIDSETLNKIFPEITIDGEYTTLLRSCLMKPEHLDFVDKIHKIIENKAKEVVSNC